MELIEKKPVNLEFFARTWLEKEEKFSKKFSIELTDEQIEILKSVTDDASVDLAKAIQKALKLTIEDIAKNAP